MRFNSNYKAYPFRTRGICMRILLGCVYGKNQDITSTIAVPIKAVQNSLDQALRICSTFAIENCLSKQFSCLQIRR
ncbi:hypothetical protein Tsubulata_028737 [Turnera subulata]|uniref:Uncharacterized protein n=1 Tax=Turnera subulata TaxID=218843 RepID=A0A9Q0GJY7_9ROSI|nr:hypothetical protein Tsubulata_028737 [Turnera subulata]